MTIVSNTRGGKMGGFGAVASGSKQVILCADQNGLG